MEKKTSKKINKKINFLVDFINLNIFKLFVNLKIFCNNYFLFLDK